jgi:Arylsulfotransferase (ASST)/Secretion system C-terminal sorting domain
MQFVTRRRHLFFFILINILCTRGVFAAMSIRTSRTRSKSDTEEYALGSHVIYVSPIPGALYVAPVTNIIIRSSEDLSSVDVTEGGLFVVAGSISGIHPGKTILSDDHKTLVFQPDFPFTPGELVTVSLSHSLFSNDDDSVSLNPFSFTISGTYDGKMTTGSLIGNGTAEPPTASSTSEDTTTSSNNSSKFLTTVTDESSLPSDLPLLHATVSKNPTPGYIFFAPFPPASHIVPQTSAYLIITDNAGSPLFYRKIASGQATDLDLQPTGVLTYWDVNPNIHYVLNTSFNVIDSITCGNGFSNDLHELRILPNGHIFLICDENLQIDMSKIVAGGNPNATVIDCAVQELDTNKNVVFQWRAIDHFNITDATHYNLDSTVIDFCHANAVEIDTDGNIILSSRHLDEITKINEQTGDIMWRFGGNNNQFTFLNDTIGFSHQHAVRRIANGDLTFFDNGNYQTPHFSRAVEYQLDVAHKTATLVWQFRHNPDVASPAMGYVQRLTNGNTIIGWGEGNPSVTEVTPQDATALEMTFPTSVYSYRAYRYPFLFITSPTSSNEIVPKKNTVIKWNSSGVDSLDIYYTTDNGASWIAIATNYPSDEDSLVWSVPSISATPCKIKITESGSLDMGLSFLSDPISVSGGIAGINSASKVFAYSLSDNYPNPFNPSTTINFSLKENSTVQLDIYNALGQKVLGYKLGNLLSGDYHRNVNMDQFSSGVYFYRIEAIAGNGEKFVATKKMLLLK